MGLLVPATTGAALFVLTRPPFAVKQQANHLLQKFLSPRSLEYLIAGLKWVFGLSIASNLNVWLGELARNNFILRSNKKKWNWNSEIAVITGASSGFGELFSRDLSSKGIRIAALDINDPPKELADNPKVTFFKCDVTSPEEIHKVAKEIQSTLGHPSILINNAGIVFQAAILDAEPEKLHKLFSVNIEAHYNLIQAFLPHMIGEKKGHIVSLCSVASFVPTSGLVHYCISKQAAEMLQKGLASELRTRYRAPEISLTTVHPHFANTAMIQPYAHELKRRGAKLLDPQVVSDAVVKQILKCRGDRIVIATAPSLMLDLLHKGPAWIQYLLWRLLEGTQAKKAQPVT